MKNSILKQAVLSLITVLTATASMASENTFSSSRWQYVDGTNDIECPGSELTIKATDNKSLFLYGSTGLGATGPFQNGHYFANINGGKTQNGNYIEETTATNNEIVENSKFVLSGTVLIEEEVRFKDVGGAAILEYRLIKNSQRAQQWRHSSFKCFYTEK